MGFPHLSIIVRGRGGSFVRGRQRKHPNFGTVLGSEKVSVKGSVNLPCKWEGARRRDSRNLLRRNIHSRALSTRWRSRSYCTNGKVNLGCVRTCRKSFVRPKMVALEVWYDRTNENWSPSGVRRTMGTIGVKNISYWISYLRTPESCFTRKLL